MQKAKELLKNPVIPVTVVAARAGMEIIRISPSCLRILKDVLRMNTGKKNHVPMQTADEK